MVAVVGGLTVLASCKKDHTCECVVETSGLINSTSTVDTTLADMTKKDAEAACEGLNSSTSAFGQTVTSTCSLK
ncbi:MAG: hypothetical protein MI810_13260 [Flavobacteriales bacterium]|nr:hypothetical protein [Flavobacteriales bacterium]